MVDPVQVSETDAAVRVEGVVSGRAGVGWPLIVVAVLVVGGVLWVVASSGGGDGSTRAPTTTVPQTDGEGDGTTTETLALGGPVSTAPAPEVTGIVEGPLLGEETGLAVLVGNERSLRHLDLDTGRTTTYEHTGGWPLHAQDGLVIFGWSGGVRILPVGDLGADPLEVAVGPPEPGTTYPSALVEGGIWVADLDDSSVIWTLIHPVTGEVLNTIVGPSASRLSGPEVTSSLAGGVFALTTDGTYTRVHDGLPIAVTTDHVLVQTCVAPIRCEYTWLARDGWQPVERAVPPFPPDRSPWVTLTADGRVLAYHTPSDGWAIFDVEAGRQLSTSTLSGNLSLLRTSPDGRYLAWLGPDLLIIDLDTEQEYRIDVSTSGITDILFLTTN